METEALKVTWKIIRRKGYGRTPETYCSYIAENNNHSHRLKTREGTKLFEMLEKTVCSKNDKYLHKVMIDGIYHHDKLLYITNPRIL